MIIKKRKSIWKKIFINIFYILISMILIVSAGIFLLLNTLELPDFSDFENKRLQNSTKIYDRTGEVELFNLHENIRHTSVSNTDISDWIKKATLAIEDKNFYNHHGISFLSIIRAAFTNITAGGYVQGASTLDQQIIKNSLLSSDKNLTRKIKEVVLSIKLDSQLSKDKILNIYLNDSPYGGSIYGVEEASLLYFNKHAKDLTINESAYLAAIPKSPTKLSPINGDRNALEKRKNLVLQTMYDDGYINIDQLKQNQADSYNFTNIASSSGRSLHFVFMVKKYLEDKYGVDVVENSGLKVITTLDWDFQKIAEDTITENFQDYIKNKDKRNVAFVAADPVTGQVLSMIGSRNYFDKNIDGQFNVALAKRNPGSSFKPFIYLKGFMSGLTPESIIFDVKTQFSTNCDEKNPTKNNTNCYSPENYTGKNYGPVSARTSLQNSINVPAVKMLYLVGVSDMLDFAGQLGIDSYKNNPNAGLSLALGGSSVSLYEMLQGYSVLANNGTKNDLHFILKITDYTNKVLEEENLNPIQVVPIKYVNVITDVLSDNNARNLVYPTNNSMFFNDRPVAAKTGTTQDYKDAWIFGYTPSVVSGLWMGNNDYTPITGGSAADTAGPIWKKIMLKYFANKPTEQFPPAEKLYADTSAPILKGNWCDEPNILTLIKGKGDSQYGLWEPPIMNWIYNNPNGCSVWGGGSEVDNNSSNNNDNNTNINDILLDINNI